ncbi:MAG: hypothetical protein WCD11_37715 [Solirubrobacteraceae bacterium]
MDGAEAFGLADDDHQLGPAGNLGARRNDEGLRLAGVEHRDLSLLAGLELRARASRPDPDV